MNTHTHTHTCTYTYTYVLSKSLELFLTYQEPGLEEFSHSPGWKTGDEIKEVPCPERPLLEKDIWSERRWDKELTSWCLFFPDAQDRI